MLTPFGRDVRERFFASLDGDTHFLNHGSYGVSPSPVMEARFEALRAVERNVDLFFRNDLKALHDVAIGALASVVGLSGDPSSLVFTDNATMGVQIAVVSALRAAGDARAKVLVDFSSTYNACQIIVSELAARTPGTTHVRVQLGPDGAALTLSDEQIVGLATAALNDAAKSGAQVILMLDHFASINGALMPVAAITAAARKVGATVIIDGAHAIGQIALDLATLDCDFYTSNLHKWLYASRHVAFLHVRASFQQFTEPLLISHHHRRSFQLKFLMQGTRDETRLVVVPAAVRFVKDQLGGFERIWAYQRDFLDRACARITAAWGTRCPFGPERRRAMALIELPDLATFPFPVSDADGFAFMSLLYRKWRIVVPIQTIGQRMYVRISAQVYVGDDSIDALLQAIAEIRAARTRQEIGFDDTRDWASYRW
jgi:isopenicillin-N epimerase